MSSSSAQAATGAQLSAKTVCDYSPECLINKKNQLSVEIAAITVIFEQAKNKKIMCPEVKEEAQTANLNRHFPDFHSNRVNFSKRPLSSQILVSTILATSEIMSAVTANHSTSTGNWLQRHIQ